MTIISNSHRFIYVHLHKCGGTSIEQAYGPRSSWNDLILGSTGPGEKLAPIYGQRYGLSKHTPASKIRDVVGEVWDAYWSFTTVRHPLKIYESFYRWIHKIVANYCDKNGITLADAAVLAREGRIDRPFMAYDVTGPFLHASDFNEFIHLLSERGMQTLHARLSDDNGLIVDDWYKLEAIDDLWPAFAARTGLTLEPRHSNKGSDIALAPWSEEAEKIVRDAHAVDLEIFEYG